MDSEHTTHTRTRTKRDVPFRCAWCSQDHTQLRYPGPQRRSCSDAWKRAAHNTFAAARMRRHREQDQGSTPLVSLPGAPMARHRA
jgi:hypothetical protein